MNAGETLGGLRATVTPPERPFGVPVYWERFRQENGFGPPSDYRALLDTYGAGAVESGLGRLDLLQPIHPARSFLEGNRWLREILLGLQADSPSGVPPWPVYPAADGFLPFALSDTGWTFGWLTTGEPEEWTTAIDGGRDGRWQEVPAGALELFRRWAQGDLGIEQVEPRPGRAAFHPSTADASWSGRSESATVSFAPSAESTDRERLRLEWIRARVFPAQLQSYGLSGDAHTPIHLHVGIGYAPADVPAVQQGIRRIAADLRTTVTAVTARDGSLIWPEMTVN